jgi:type IV secretion system protein VirB10
MQMWLMLGLAGGILGIIVFAGRQAQTPLHATPAPVQANTAMNPDRLRDFQDRLRVVDERTRKQMVDEAAPRTDPQPLHTEPRAARSVDPLIVERKRRDYESLFASNVVMSRRPESERLTPGDMKPTTRGASSRVGDDLLAAPPSVDDVAEAVVRATARYTSPPATAAASGASVAHSIDSPPPIVQTAPGVRSTPVVTGPITSDGPMHRVLEGTVIETVLTNRLDGGAASPVNCLVTTPIYSHDGQYIVIPAGSRVLGETKPVQTFGDTRLAVAFYRLVMPDGRTYRLDRFMGLDDIGDAGLRDQVNQQYRSTFGASAAVGLITGFAQYLGTAGFNRGAGDRTVVIAGNVGDATAQATAQTMSRFLNRYPTITIREGHRVKIYLTSDLELPAYGTRDPSTRSLIASGALKGGAQ